MMVKEKSKSQNLTKNEKLIKGFNQLQGYWSQKAKDKGILTEKDLVKYLKK